MTCWQSVISFQTIATAKHTVSHLGLQCHNHVVKSRSQLPRQGVDLNIFSAPIFNTQESTLTNATLCLDLHLQLKTKLALIGWLPLVNTHKCFLCFSTSRTPNKQLLFFLSFLLCTYPLPPLFFLLQILIP